MPRFLTAAWAEAYNEALAGVALPPPGPDAGLAAVDGRFTMAEEVRGAPDGDVRLLVAAEDGGLHFRVDPLVAHRTEDDAGAGPDVTIVVSYADAVAMSTGELTPAEALNGGRIRVRGDLSVLVAAQAMIDAARRLLEGPATATTY